MRNNAKVVALSEINCPEDVVRNLERLHYETTSHERILALTLANDAINLEGPFKTYYENYLVTFKEYEEAKLELFNAYLTKIKNIEKYRSWEVDFRTKVVNLYE